MKDKLEVGMYVRILWGNGEQTISKCTNKVDIGDTQYSKNDFYIHTDKKGEVIYKSMIVKTSHNIIDLIEVEDVITTDNMVGEITTIDRENDKIYLACFDFDTISSQDIKSIVTKEQFESMAYRLGDE